MYGEFVLAQNLDRGLYVADPISAASISESLACTRAPCRRSRATPSSASGTTYTTPTPTRSTSAAGASIPLSEAVKTLSQLVGLVLPDKERGDRARLILQYDMISNAFARTNTGVPTNLADNVWTVRLQVKL